MADLQAEDTVRQQQRQSALSRWEDEGGSTRSSADDLKSGVIAPPLTNTEILQMRVRVIALENLVLALLADSSDVQHDLVRELASHILPRPGRTAHPMTIHAAEQMLSLQERARRFRRL